MKIPTPHNVSYEESMTLKDHLMIYDLRVDPKRPSDGFFFNQKLKRYLFKRQTEIFYNNYKDHWFLKKNPLFLCMFLGIICIGLFFILTLENPPDIAFSLSIVLFSAVMMVRMAIRDISIYKQVKPEMTKRLNEIRAFYAYHGFDYRLKPIHEFIANKIDALGEVIKKFNAKYWDKITFSEQANLIPELGQKVGNYAEHLRKTKTLYEVQWTFYTMVEDGLRDFKDRLFTQQSLYQDTKTGLLEISIAPASFEEELTRIEKVMHEVMKKPLTVRDIEQNTKTFERYINDFENIFISPQNNWSLLSKREDPFLK